MLTFPNSKINLGLQITEKRSDGYHNLISCFYPINWCDVLEILPSEKVHFQFSGIPIPGDIQNNICLKAYQLLQKDFDLPAVQIHLHKIIPIGAGLGGGSADGAYTIKTLNELFSLQMTVEQMQNYTRQLGSDCSFFIENTPKLCFEKGDQFENITIDLSKYYIALVYPNIHISTQQAYAGIKPQKPLVNLQQVLQQPLSSWKDHLKNDFEESIFPKYPIIGQIKDSLYQQGALYASMSGSGSTVYGIFSEKIDLNLHFVDKPTIYWQEPHKV